MTLVRVLVSQPLPRLPSQFPKPELQTGAQAPALQAVVPFGFVQVVPQPPQLLTVLSGVSQPLLAAASQLPKPLLHVPSVQLPVAHDSEAFARLQGMPQPLQLVVVRMLVSQPSLGSPSQLEKPVLQLGVQTPPLQAVVPLSLSQIVPQAPQFEVVFSGVSQPFSLLPSQLPKPALHVIEQAPRAQLALPLAVPQTVPQAPQLVMLVWVLVSQPFGALPSQLPQGAVQLGAQAPALQTVLP